MGNAVCPMVASALGRCLALAAQEEAPSSVDEAVVSVPDPDYLQVRQQNTRTACFVEISSFYCIAAAYSPPPCTDLLQRSCRVQWLVVTHAISLAPISG